MNGNVRILEVDPALRRTGWVVLEQGSALDQDAFTSEGSDRPVRLQASFEQMEEPLSWMPEVAYFECNRGWRRRGGTKFESIEGVAMARAVMMVSCTGRGIPVVEVEFHAVRRELLGRPNAGHDEILHYLQKKGFDVPRRPRRGLT